MKFNLVGPAIQPHAEGSQQLHFPPTNPGHTKATLYLTPPPTSSEIVGIVVAEVEIIAPNTVQLTLPDNFNVITTDGRGNGTENENCLNDVIGPQAAPLQLWYRCPSCKNRTLARMYKLTDEARCKHCGRDLRLVNWTGRVGDAHTAPIIDITPEYANMWLRANGWLQRKHGLWAKLEGKVVNYVDFTKKPFKPTVYAYYEDGSGRPDKPTKEMKHVYIELVPYFERLTAKEIAIKKSHPERICNLQGVRMPEEDPAPETVPIVQTVQHLVDKCPDCQSEDLRTIENTAGKATSCNKCNKTVFQSDEEEENDKTGRTPTVDSNFF